MKIISARVLILGVLLFFVPLFSFIWQPGPAGKIAALHSMLTSLTGLLLVSFTLWFQFNLRRREQMEANRVLLNSQRLEAMIAKRTQTVNSVQKFR
jgi:hypothetical protein